MGIPGPGPTDRILLVKDYYIHLYNLNPLV